MNTPTISLRNDQKVTSTGQILTMGQILTRDGQNLTTRGQHVDEVKNEDLSFSSAVMQTLLDAAVGGEVSVCL